MKGFAITTLQNNLHVDVTPDQTLPFMALFLDSKSFSGGSRGVHSTTPPSNTLYETEKNI